MPATQRDSDRPLAVVNLGSLLRNMAGVYVGLYNDNLIIIDIIILYQAWPVHL